MLEWKNDKQSDFAIKSNNSKHITELLEWIIDVPISIKDKTEKTIRKVQDILDPNKNQFQIKLHEKTYIILTYNKAPVAKDLLKEEQK
ncbi:10526_t:CDS:2, partial [Cetraspora pellucida]